MKKLEVAEYERQREEFLQAVDDGEATPRKSNPRHDAILASFLETGSMAETARQVGCSQVTVSLVLKKQRGICNGCSEPMPFGKTYCDACSEKRAELTKGYRAARIRAGRCIRCDEVVHPPSRSFCYQHRLDALDYQRERRKQSKAARQTHGGAQTRVYREKHIRGRYGEAGITVWRKLDGKCSICSVDYESRTLHMHHLNRDQSQSTEENLTLLCKPCHDLVHRLLDADNPERSLSWIRKTYPTLSWENVVCPN